MLQSRFLWKLYAGYVVLILLSSIIVGVMIARQTERDSLSEIQNSLETTSILLRQLARPSLESPLDTPSADEEFQRQVQALGERIGTRLTVIRIDGLVQADSQEEPSSMDNHATRPEILEALSHGQGTATRFSETVGTRMMYLALPVESEGQRVGYVRASLPLLAIDQRMARVRSIVLLGTVVSAAVALLLGFVIARRFTRPLTSMAAVAEGMAEGDYSRRVDIARQDEVGQLAHALNRMAESSMQRIETLHRLERARRDFVANVSHELKTPVAAILGLVETLMDDQAMTSDVRNRFLAKIQSQSLRASTVVADLLTLSRLESETSPLESESVDLVEIVRTQVQALLETAKQSGISMELELPERQVTLRGDERALSQVTSNLLDNALNYTPAEGKVSVRLKQLKDSVLLEIEDTGVGIEPSDQDRIFERFYRVDRGRSREMGGTGLGLAIVKHIALAHGGAVSLESHPGKGSIFTVTLPLQGG